MSNAAWCADGKRCCMASSSCESDSWFDGLQVRHLPANNGSSMALLITKLSLAVEHEPNQWIPPESASLSTWPTPILFGD